MQGKRGIGRLMVRSIVLGAIVGGLAAVVLTIDSTIRQPNYEPASFLVALVWIFPYLLIGGIVIGVLVGVATGAAAIPISRVRRRRTLYVLVFLLGIAIALVLVTHPTLWITHAPTNVIVVLISAFVAVVWARRVYPTSPKAA